MDQEKGRLGGRGGLGYGRTESRTKFKRLAHPDSPRSGVQSLGAADTSVRATSWVSSFSLRLQNTWVTSGVRILQWYDSSTVRTVDDGGALEAVRYAIAVSKHFVPYTLAVESVLT